MIIAFVFVCQITSGNFSMRPSVINLREGRRNSNRIYIFIDYIEECEGMLDVPKFCQIGHLI